MGRLTAEQKKFYEDNGYIVLKNVLPKDLLDEISDEYDKLFARKNPKQMEGAWVGSDENGREHEGETLVKSIHNLQYHHAVFSKYLFNESLLDALEDIMKTKNIAIHHTKAHIKPAQKSGEFVMHQDYHYFPHKNDSMIAAFLHLDAAYPENGGLFVYPGSHKLGPLEDVGAQESNYHYLDQSKWPLSGAEPLVADRGDVVVFSYLLIHGSPPNKTDKPRRMLLLQASDAHDEPLPVKDQPLKAEKELDKISEEYDKLFARQDPRKIEGAWIGSDEGGRGREGETLIKGIHNLQYHNAIFSSFIFNKNLLDALEDIMNTSNIVLHHTKANMKPAQKNGEFMMHQDYHYFPFKNDSPIAAFLHLDAAFPENGGLVVYPGSHKLGPQDDFGAKVSNFHYLDQTKWPMPDAVPVIAERGDVLVFSYLLIHGSPPNKTDKPRRMLLLQAADAHDEPVGDQALKPGQGWLLRGQNLNRDASIAKRNLN